MYCFTFKINVCYFKIDCFLSPQTCGIYQSKYDTVFKKPGRPEERLELPSVKNDRQAGFFLKRRQADSSFMLSGMTIIIAKTIDHVFKTTTRWRCFVYGQGGEILAEFIIVDELRKTAEVQADLCNFTDVIAQGALALPLQRDLLLHCFVNFFKTRNFGQGPLNNCRFSTFFS